jgi:UDP-N-acetylglucosamine 4,6-dehydratase
MPSAADATRHCLYPLRQRVGSRGSGVPSSLQQRPSGRLTITDERMTRFWISLEQGVRFVIRCIEQCRACEVFVPKIPSMNMMDLARAVAPEAQWDIIGIRPGEKLHETLIFEDEARTTVELPDMFRRPAGIRDVVWACLGKTGQSAAGRFPLFQQHQY